MYDARYTEEQEAKYKRALETTKINCDAFVLDVGCGTGLLFSHIAKAQVVVGIDLSRSLLTKAKERASKQPNVHTIQADVDHLPFRNDCFDVIFAFTVLQNFPKPLKALDEMKRVAKVTAQIVVTGLKKAFPLHAFADLLEQAGLRIVFFADDEALKCYVSVNYKTQN